MITIATARSTVFFGTTSPSAPQIPLFLQTLYRKSNLLGGLQVSTVRLSSHAPSLFTKKKGRALPPSDYGDRFEQTRLSLPLHTPSWLS